ncbi:MAG TPA: M14 family zinc carboxypeptidase [Acidobacteriota bacterium]|nr:M14 family zinc carboxypeptidase [Acidobacteriota bacterium]
MTRHSCLVVALSLALLFVALLAVAPSTAAPLTDADRAFLAKKIVARVQITRPDLIAEAYARGVDILEDNPNPAAGYFTILVDAAELADLTADDYQIDVLDYDRHKTYTTAVYEPNGGFRTFGEGAMFLDSMHMLYPDITTARFSIGYSFELRQLWAIKVSDNPEIDENEVEILITGMHHAREPIAQEIPLETLRALVTGYGVDPRITTLVDEREIYIIPCVNPDGYEYNRTIAPLGGGMWRKNRNNSGSDIGIDLNRNYGYAWGYDNIGSSGTPSSSTYRGTGPFSEPETANMRAFVNSREFLFALNYHSWSDLYLWAWGYDYIYTPDQAFFQEIGDSLATYNGYTAQVGWELYPTNGDSDDWMYGATDEHPMIFSFTPEVGGSNDAPGYDAFWPYPDSIPSLIAENLGPTLALLGWEYVDFTATPVFGDAPLTVEFTGITRGTPQGWVWDFHDGDSAFVQNPDHTFLPGLYDVGLNTLTPTGGGDVLKTAYVTAVAESLSVPAAAVMAGESYVWDVSLTNHVPIEEFLLTVTLSNVPTYAKFDSLTVAGTRAAYFERRQLLYDNRFFGELAVRYIADNGGGAPPLAPGSGPIARVYVTLKPEAVPGDSVILSFAEPIATHTLSAITGGTTFALIADSGALTILTPPCACDCHADPECDGVINVLDVVLAVNTAFRGAPPIADPVYACPYVTTDVTCDGVTNVLDVVHFVNAAFRGGDPAVEFCDPCAP